MTALQTSIVKDWFVSAQIDSLKQFHLSDAILYLKKIEHCGSEGVAYRSSVLNQHPGPWKVCAFSGMIQDLQEKGYFL